MLASCHRAFGDRTEAGATRIEYQASGSPTRTPLSGIWAAPWRGFDPAQGERFSTEISTDVPSVGVQSTEIAARGIVLRQGDFVWRGAERYTVKDWHPNGQGDLVLELLEQ